MVADHNHPISLIGTIDDDMTKTPNAPLRERVGIYDKAEFPELSGARQGRLPAARRRQPPARDLLGERRPTTTRPSGRSSTIRTIRRSTGQDTGTYDANERYRDMPGAMLRLGNLPKYLNASVHSGEDVILTATGPGSERVRGQMDNTEVFRVIAEALGLGRSEGSRREAGLICEATQRRPASC